MDRTQHPNMEYYRHVFKDSKLAAPTDDWLGKRTIIYGEQGFGDIIQFSRYVAYLSRINKDLMFYVPKDLHRIFSCFGVQMLDKDNPELPDHDYHVLSMDLPFYLPSKITLPDPYIRISETQDLEAGFKHVGIAWEGSPTNAVGGDRNCPLKYFKMLEKEGTRLYSLQKTVHTQELIKGCEDMDLYSVDLEDFYETAKLVASLDMVVTIDTSVAHLAGAMGKPTYLLLSTERDFRWDTKGWYNSMVCIRMKDRGNWGLCMETVLKLTSGMDKDCDTDFSEEILN
jgi:hypothetical protein